MFKPYFDTARCREVARNFILALPSKNYTKCRKCDRQVHKDDMTAIIWDGVEPEEMCQDCHDGIMDKYAEYERDWESEVEYD